MWVRLLLGAQRDSAGESGIIEVMNTTKAITLAGIAIVLLAVGALLTAFSENMKQDRLLSITSFDECVAAGNPVMESFPEQCRTQDGRLFVNERQSVPGPITSNGCAVAGCSGQLCVALEEADGIVTTCEFRAEYACYAEASCEPQETGECGWTETPELLACLESPPPLEPEAEFEGVPQAI